MTTTRLARGDTRVAWIATVLAAAMTAPVLAEQQHPRTAYFGEQHVHTSWSLDSFLAFGTSLSGPEQFYQYALGQTVKHGSGGFPVRITKPLDWAATTEHAEYLGALLEAQNPDSPLGRTLLGKGLKFGSREFGPELYKLLAAGLVKGHPIEELKSRQVLAPIWKRLIETADRYYKPGSFTTFAAFEWTSTPKTANLHRNVFFRDTQHVPEVPFSAIDSDDPRELWKWMDNQRSMGNELLAISHNSNLSNGLMFPTEVDDRGRPIDHAWSESRMRNEPLAELKQVKGQSETTPALSPNDEFAGYEVVGWQLLGGKGDPRQYGSYIRQAYKDGIAMQGSRGYNPYKFGVVSGSDSHSTVVPYRQKNFFGVHGNQDDTTEKRLSGKGAMGFNNLWATPAGLSVVWAEENTREAIFDALRRKETYSTSGTRIVLRLFGAWTFSRDLVNRKGWVRTAYERGVPMGSDLPSPAAKAPSFIVQAVKDPDSANLDRVQIVKGWTKYGQSFERVYDVAWSGKRKPDPASGRLPVVGSTVDISRASYRNTIGSVQLTAVWTDPDFDPHLDAFYYARVLEIPTPRWSTIQAAQSGRTPPDGVAAVIQERAWSSPIWYIPDEPARLAAKPGVTVAELKQKGALTLDDAQLRDLIVGKTVRVHNTVTGQRFEILYGGDGRRLVTGVDGKTPDPEVMGELSHGAQVAYQIHDGHLVTEIAGTPFEVSVFKLGDKYIASRGNEFGFANYEVEASTE